MNEDIGSDSSTGTAESHAQLGTVAQAKSPAEVLIAARKLIEKEENWGKAGWGAGRHCAQTAISSVTDCYNAAHPALQYLGDIVAPERTDLMGRVWKWNDAPERTHAEVLAAFDRAILALSLQPQSPTAHGDLIGGAEEVKP